MSASPINSDAQSNFAGYDSRILQSKITPNDIFREKLR